MARSPLRSFLPLGSFLLYSFAVPIVTRYADPSGVAGVLFVLPLVLVTRSRGRRAGLLMAVLGVLLNVFCWITLGNGLATMQHQAGLAGGEILGAAAGFVATALVVDRFFSVSHELEDTRSDADRTRRLLEESEKRYRDLVEDAPSSIVVIVDRTLRYVNRLFVETVGYAAEELLGLEFIRLVHPEDADRVMKRHIARMAGAPPQIFPLRYVRKDGQVRWGEAAGELIDWEGRPGILYFLNDVTDRKALERQLVQAQKMEAVGRLASGVAHDFNNLLQVILGFTESMRTRADDAFARDLGVVEETARRAASLTQHLLAFSRRESLAPRVIDLGEVVRQSVQMLGSMLGDDVSLEADSSAEPLLVRADPGEMHQVLMNLAVNARDAMPAGGTLTIGVSGTASHVQLSVRDTGTGMDRAVLSHLYEPFFTTKEAGKGTGLGLSTVYGIVQRADGVIEVQSEPGKGTVFTITFPRVTDGAAKSATPADAIPAAGIGSILLVEDAPDVRRVVRAMLEGSGFTVTEADRGEKALEILKARTFDLLLTDLVMPGMNGTSLARATRLLCPSLPVMFMSGHVDNESLAEVGTSSLIHKPFVARELARAVQKAMQGHPIDEA